MRTEKGSVSRNGKKQSGQGDVKQDSRRKAKGAKASAGWEKTVNRAEEERPAEEWREGQGASEEPEELSEGMDELFEALEASEEPEDHSADLDAAGEPEELSEGPEEAAEELEYLLEDLAGTDPEEDVGEPEEWSGEEEWEEEEEPLKLWKAVVVFLALIGLAAVVCAVLWHFSHADDPEDAGGTQGQISGSASWPSSGSDASGSVSQGTDAPDASEASDQPYREPISGTKDMEFVSVQHSVTPKDVINLRSVPDTSDTGNIVTQIQNGEVLSRTGINEETGWSEIEYEGRTLYGVSQFLTTDLDYKTPEASGPNRVSTKDGRVIIFVDCDDWISPKEYVNLRTEPSTSEGSSTVSCQLNYGEKAHRTGFSPDSGWSRVEYKDQVLYVVTSLMLVEEE